MTIEGPGRNLVLRSLPPVVHLPGRPDQTGSAPSVAVRGLDHLLAAIRIEANGDLPAAEPMIDRMAELMLLQVLRAAIEHDPASLAWFAGSGDENLARALTAMYQQPGRAWTVAALAAEAHMSRSAFAAAFRNTMGTTPLKHLTAWRMALAADLIAQNPNQPLAQVATGVGYRNEAAFGSAFRRHIGHTPGSHRSQPTHLAPNAAAE
jgi:transcriptional regulator GlxA family with amidase domain